MDSNHLAAVARRLAGTASRRGSLLTLGSAGLAALSGRPLSGSAKKKHKKRNKKDDKKCKRQVGQCNGVFAPLCADPDAPEDCVEQVGLCCNFLGDCRADAFLDCFLELLGIPEEAPV